MRALAVLLLAMAPVELATAAPPAPTTIVVCAPGYPGSTAEAQGAMDAFAAAVAAAAGPQAGSLAAIYEETEAGGVVRMQAKDAGLVLVTLPFFLAHEKELGLVPRLQVTPEGRGALERWTLVARKGRVTRPAALDGFTVSSIAGYAPRFVRGMVSGWGVLSADVKIVQSAAVLSSLRRAAGGDPVAVLLDGQQAAAVGSLPFAADLDTVTRSPEVPTGIVATVGHRLAPARLAAISKALLGLGSTPGGATALSGIRMTGFVPLDAAALARAREAYARASK